MNKRKKTCTSLLRSIIILALFCFLGLQSAAATAPCVSVVEDQTVADQFTRHTVTGITTALPEAPDVPGFLGAAFLSIGDLDANGTNEVVCTSGVGLDANGYLEGDGAVAVFTRDGAGMGSWTQSVINATFSFPNETVLRDMDSDGDIDIMVLDNFIASWYTGGLEGIYYLENLGGDILDPANWVRQTIHQGAIDPTRPAPPCFGADCTDGIASYHRAIFMDIDGDGLEDFVTSKVDMYRWQKTPDQYRWVEWFKKEDPTDNGTKYSGPYEIGDGGGFLFELADIDGDGDQDIVAGQFLIADPGTLVTKGAPDGSDIRGDTLAWFENPGEEGDVFSLWNRYAIDNWYTSPNPMGKAMETIIADVDNDGADELVFSSHNHQQYYGNPAARIWPSGIYYLEIPGQPDLTEQWDPVTIDSGDPALDPNDPVAVAGDPFAVDRDTSVNGALSQGSPGMVRAGDINRDGLMDLVVAGDGKGALYYYQAQSSGGCLSFKRCALYNDPESMPAEARIADVDGDGDLEIIATVFDTSYVRPHPANTTSSSIFIFEIDEGMLPECGNGIVEDGEECEADGDCAQGESCEGCSCEPATIVELAQFNTQARWNRVEISWVTAAEIDNAGFNLYRATAADGPYDKINQQLITATGAENQAAAYSITDSDVQRGTIYYYKLEDIDLNGTATKHGPVSAKPGLLSLLGK